jgi:hypothetical protein
MRTWLFPSSKDKNDKYEITERNGGQFVCTCNGYTVHKHCYHSDLIKQFVDAGVEFLGDF